jgi:hypothetical protein
MTLTIARNEWFFYRDTSAITKINKRSTSRLYSQRSEANTLLSSIWSLSQSINAKEKTREKGRGNN